MSLFCIRFSYNFEPLLHCQCSCQCSQVVVVFKSSLTRFLPWLALLYFNFFQCKVTGSLQNYAVKVAFSTLSMCYIKNNLPPHDHNLISYLTSIVIIICVLCTRWTAGHWGCCCMLLCTVACHLMGPVTLRSLSRSAKVATVDPIPPQVNLYNAHDSISII